MSCEMNNSLEDDFEEIRFDDSLNDEKIVMLHKNDTLECQNAVNLEWLEDLVMKEYE